MDSEALAGSYSAFFDLQWIQSLDLVADQVLVGHAQKADIRARTIQYLPPCHRQHHTPRMHLRPRNVMIGQDYGFENPAEACPP